MKPVPQNRVVTTVTEYSKFSELVTRQEARKQDSELRLGAHKKIRGQPVKN
jgi:hypothetical protein